MNLQDAWLWHLVHHSSSVVPSGIVSQVHWPKWSVCGQGNLRSLFAFLFVLMLVYQTMLEIDSRKCMLVAASSPHPPSWTAVVIYLVTVIFTVILFLMKPLQ